MTGFSVKKYLFSLIIFFGLIGRQRADAMELRGVDATWLQDRHHVLINLQFLDSLPTQVSIGVSCVDGRSTSQSKSFAHSASASFELPLPNDCSGPVIDVIENIAYPKENVTTEVRIIPTLVVVPASSGMPQPTWVAPIVSAGLGGMFTLVTAFLVALGTRSREEAKVRRDLRIGAVQEELAACESLLKVCSSPITPQRVEEEFDRLRNNLAADSPILAGYTELRNSIIRDDGITSDNVDKFRKAIQVRKKDLLSNL